MRCLWLDIPTHWQVGGEKQTLGSQMFCAGMSFLRVQEEFKFKITFRISFFMHFYTQLRSTKIQNWFFKCYDSAITWEEALRISWHGTKCNLIWYILNKTNKIPQTRLKVLSNHIKIPCWNPVQHLDMESFLFEQVSSFRFAADTEGSIFNIYFWILMSS